MPHRRKSRYIVFCRGKKPVTGFNSEKFMNQNRPGMLVSANSVEVSLYNLLTYVYSGKMSVRIIWKHVWSYIYMGSNFDAVCFVIIFLYKSHCNNECCNFISAYSIQSQIQLSAVIMRSNVVRYYIDNYRDWGRIPIRYWIHKWHPIPRPNGRAMWCLSWIFVRKLTAL